MIKRSMIIVTSSLLLASCAERGGPQVSQPHISKRITKNNSTIDDRNIPVLTVRAKNSNTSNSTQNKVSGGLILLIGALVFL